MTRPTAPRRTHRRSRLFARAARRGWRNFVGSRVVAPPISRLTAGALRVLGYHGVTNPERFSQQIEYLAREFTPVGSMEVVEALRGDRALPERAVWVTFDDGLGDVVEAGLPILARYGVPATIFVCPGLIESGEPFWFEAVFAALKHGLPIVVHGRRWSDDAVVNYLRTLDDARRRSVVDALVADLRERGLKWGKRKVTEAELERWRDAGNDLGNHTWDHPSLDRCSPEEQRFQLAAADTWLDARQSGRPRIFAYPFGSRSATTEGLLLELGYDLALLHDDRLASVSTNAYRVSRLNVGSEMMPNHFRATMSGLYPISKLAARLRG